MSPACGHRLGVEGAAKPGHIELAALEPRPCAVMSALHHQAPEEARRQAELGLVFEERLKR